MNLINLLLQTDKDLTAPSIEREIPRLTKALGEKFVVELKPLTFDKYSEIQDKCLNLNGKDVRFDAQEFNILLTMNATYVNGERLFYNKDLKARYGAVNAKELCKKLLTVGEISKLGDEITGLCGFGDNVVEEVKN